MKARLGKLSRKDLLTFAVFGFFLSTLLYFQISPITFNNYQTICSAEHPGKIEAFNKCMDPYWSQYYIDRALLIAVLILSVLSGIFAASKSARKG